MNMLQEYCEEPCGGTDSDLASIQAALVSGSVLAQMSELFKALSDPTRLRIIHALSLKELCVHDLTVVLEMGQSAVSHQLRVLRNLRIVKRRKVGKTVYYSLDDGHIEQIFAQTMRHAAHE